MKNKKVIYLLLLLTLAIWGGIFYRIYQSLGGGEEEYTVISPMEFAMDSNFQIQSDTFALSLDYSDPFLHGIRKIEATKPIVPKPKARPQTRQIIRQAPPKPVTPKKKPKVMRWPKIAYKGMVSNEKSGKKLVLVDIDKTDHILAVGDTISKVKVLQIWRDSLQLQLQGERKTFYGGR